MTMSTSCRECESIELEYRKACLDIGRTPSVEIREACQVLARLAGGTRR